MTFICWACGTSLTWGETDNYEPDGTPHDTSDLQHQTAFYWADNRSVYRGGRTNQPLSAER